MPLIIKKLDSIPTHTRLFKKRINKDKNTAVNVYHANEVTNDVKINKTQQIIFNMLDKLSPTLTKHPKLYNFVVRMGEFSIKMTNKISNNI